MSIILPPVLNLFPINHAATKLHSLQDTQISNISKSKRKRSIPLSTIVSLFHQVFLNIKRLYRIYKITRGSYPYQIL